VNPGFLLAPALWLFAQPLQSGPPIHYGPMRNTFIVAAETVVDNAGSVNVDADDATFTAQMQSLKVSKDNLIQLAAEEREQDIATDSKEMIFMLASCHIQSIDGAKTDTCKNQVARTMNHIMVMIGKHKAGGSWVDGAPSVVMGS
jgi:hypothetical protein